MAFSKTMVEKFELPGALVLERGRWLGTAVTTGNVTADTAVKPVIADVVMFGFASDGDTAVLPATDVSPNVVKITFTSGDAGSYFLVGKAR